MVTVNNGAVRLLDNRVGAGKSWLQVRLEDGPANRFGLGALVTVEREGAPPQVRRVRTDGSYLSANDPTLQFGLNDWSGPVTVRVDWLGGASERWVLPKVRQRVTLKRGTGTRRAPVASAGCCNHRDTIGHRSTHGRIRKGCEDRTRSAHPPRTLPLSVIRVFVPSGG